MANTPNTASEKTAKAATYASLFPEQLADKCSPDALESNNGLVAYLYALYRQSMEVEAVSTSPDRLTLDKRRPDIAELVLSKGTLENQVSPLTLAINALTRQAQSHAGEGKRLPEEISESWCCATPPFHYPLEQIQAVLTHKRLPLFELLQTTEYGFPNFCYGHLRTNPFRQVMRNASGFSPTLQAILLDTTEAGDEDFLKKRFGLTEGGTDKQLETLRKVETFCKHTALTPDQVYDLLAVSGVPDNATTGFSSVKRSQAYAVSGKAAVDGHLYGASFINNGTSPTLTLKDTLDAPGLALEIVNADASSFGRIHKLIQLQRALKLTFAETDLLLMSALRAEGQTKDFKITPNTLRAFGVFRFFKEAYDVSPEQFSALIHQVSPYALGDKVPFLDRVLDGPGAGQLAEIHDRLILDDTEFEPRIHTSSDEISPMQSAIGRLCRALGMSDHQANIHLVKITKALGLKKLKLSLDLTSSLYRLSRLPRLMHLPADEGASLIALMELDNADVSSVLSGKPTISDDDEKPDILDILVGLANIQRWLHREQLSASGLITLLTPLPIDISEDSKPLFGVGPHVIGTLGDALPRVRDSLLSLAKIKEALGEVGGQSVNWFNVLGRFFTDQGVVKPIAVDTENTLIAQLQTALKGKLAQSSQEAEAAANLETLLVNTRIAQEDVTCHILSTAFGGGTGDKSLSPNHALALMRWTGTSLTNVLSDILAAAASDEQETEQIKVPLRNLSFNLWATLARHALIIQWVKLSPAGLIAMLDHPQWFDFEEQGLESGSDQSTDSGSTVLSLDLFYQLTRYREWVNVCRANDFDESDALGYLAGLPESDEYGAITAATQRLSELIGWQHDETLHATPQVSIAGSGSTSSAPTKGSLEEYLTTLTFSERSYYNYCDKNVGIKGLGVLIKKYHQKGEGYPNANAIYDKFASFIDQNSGSLKVEAKDYLPDTAPSTWRTVSTNVKSEKTIKLVKYDNKVAKTFDDFLGTLTTDERNYFEKPGKGIKSLLAQYHYRRENQTYPSAPAENEYLKFKSFVLENPGPLLVSAKQYEDGYHPETWNANRKKSEKEGIAVVNPKNLELTIHKTSALSGSRENENLYTLPNTVSDIDYIMRLQGLCSLSALSCQSLLNLSQLNEASAYEQFQIAGQLLMGACSDDDRIQIEPKLQEVWRDALVAYLMGHWVPSNTVLQTYVPKADDLSSYFLTDVWASSEAKQTTEVGQAIASLQHYLHRHYSHLEPGYDSKSLPGSKSWQAYLGQYISWNQWQVQINHPENLIYYANRPNKTTAFQELEVEVNQGKLDTELLETAVLNYLTKFERLSNLQIVSGYVDGRDPKKDTYYLIGKTNTSPAEYYLRSVDTGLRDDQQRLSPLAWTEWEKIDLATTGNVVQSTFTEQINKVDEKGNAIKENDEPVKVPRTHHIDAVRPVIIAGRPYVFWVERDSTPLPSKNPKDQAPTNYKRISVNYIYLQSDGFWSTANELMRLDGTKEGKRGPDEDNPYLKDDDYVPGLIAFVNVEGPRRDDPWLTVILYDSAKDSIGTLNKDYFVEMRDLLLINRQTLAPDSLSTLVTAAYNSYKNITTVQHKFNGNAWIYTPDKTVIELSPRSTYESNTTTSLRGRIFINAREDDHKPLTAIISVRVKLEKTYNKLTLFVRAGDKREFVTKKNSNEIDFNYYFDRQNNIKDSYDIAIEVYGDGYVGVYKNTVKITAYKQAFDEEWNILVKQTEDQAQYLDLSSVKNKAPLLASDNVRLNTLFGKNLVARATQSADTAINWDTQQLKEPTVDAEQPNPSVDFHGANGLYFRELFLHLPALIATRLTEQQQFEDAETWYLRYLFDPYRAVSDEDGRPAYWNTRPLAEVGTLTSDLSKQVDPVARAFILSRYYRQAVFLNLVENWQKQGDHYYRQLTLSTLNHAWLCYQQALKLIGPLPERAAVSRWSPVRLGSVTAQTFRTPVNNRVFEARKIIESRLYNLRHGLTIDGKALPNLGWGDEGGDPFASAKGGLSIIAATYNSNRAPIPAYRFRQLLPAARAAAQQLLDMGRHYLKLMEDESNTTLDVLLKSQELRISDFTIRLQKEAIASVQTTKKTLLLSKQALEGRKSRYEQLLQLGRSPLEEASMAMSITSRALNAASLPFEVATGITEAITPTIFGLAFGNNQPAQPMARTALALRTLGTLSEYASEYLSTEAGYERRASEWQFELQQTEWDIKRVEAELEGVSVELNAATISLQQAIQERANLKEAHTAMTTGFTIIPVYNWLVARQELLYGSAYDAVLSLCLSLESAWRFEIGDYKRSAFIKTSAWSDTYKGMLAGESLLVDLQEMENAYLLANERRLTIKKSFSLNKLLGAKWTEEVQNLSRGKPAVFGLKSSDFDKNFPNQYLRQLKHVSVSFVLKEEKAADEIAAILTQTANTTLIEPDKKGDEYLKKGGEEIPASIRRNLRAHQQIALSSQEQEDGLGYSAGEWVYELMFHDGRYLPFEGTGAISEWTLEIPGTDFASSPKDAITDIKINLVYTALPKDRTLGS